MKKPLSTLPHIELFVAAAEALNFTKAAENLGMTAAGVSRAIANLEQRLGVVLFKRTTRSVALTEEGRLLHERAAQMLLDLGNLEEGLQGNQTELKGTLRISAPSTYGNYRLLKVLPLFAAAHPNLDIQVSISNRNVNLIDDGFDVAIRLGNLADSRIISKTLENAALGFYAAPSYLKARGTPKRIEDLRNHLCVPFILPSTGKPLPWLYRQNGEDLQWMPKGKVQVEDDVLGCLRYCASGGGICQTLDFVAEECVAQGALVPILLKHRGPTRQFSFIYRKGALTSPKIKALSEFLGKTVK